MPKRDLNKLTTRQYINLYDPTRSTVVTVTKAEWKKMKPVVVAAVATCQHLAISTVSPFLAAATKLTHFALTNHIPMKVERVFDAATIQAFENALAKGALDPTPLLRRMAANLGTIKSVTDAPGSAKKAYTTPYSSDEVATLIEEARNQATDLRRATLLSIVFLGAGCGVVREAARDVTAADLHQHGADWFVATPTHCARVLGDYLDVAQEVRELRPTGRLRGETQADRVTEEAAKWIAQRRGVPALSADRLRAFYVHELISRDHSLKEVLAWTGLRTALGLDAYLAQNPLTYQCGLLGGTQ